MAAYRRKLGHLPKDAVSFIVDRALDRCRWFPTIAECLEIASEWERNDSDFRDRENARADLRRENQARMEDAMTMLAGGQASQDQIDALPSQWKSIAETRGLLRYNDGEYTIRLSPVNNSLPDE